MRVLLLEDQPDIAEPLVDVLRRARYDVVAVHDLDQAYEALTSTTFDLAILDVMLPSGEDAGFDFAADLREVGFTGQILFISARDAELDTVRGLDLGGDDYLVKPFGLAEFMARVRALLRRTAQTKRTILDRHPLLVDLSTRRVAWEGEVVDVSDREFAILELFALYPDRVFTVDELLERFFPDASSGPSVVRVYVSQLRHKVAEELIRTVSGGYRLGPA
ncbi:MAG TPA: response regulator transcription factor [Trueperaceae bacterium]|nr:response regulator transcription factor [Trueperaceae bacterium]